MIQREAADRAAGERVEDRAALAREVGQNEEAVRAGARRGSLGEQFTELVDKIKGFFQGLKK